MVKIIIVLQNYKLITFFLGTNKVATKRSYLLMKTDNQINQKFRLYLDACLKAYDNLNLACNNGLPIIKLKKFNYFSLLITYQLIKTILNCFQLLTKN